MFADKKQVASNQVLFFEQHYCKIGGTGKYKNEEMNPVLHVWVAHSLLWECQLGQRLMALLTYIKLLDALPRRIENPDIKTQKNTQK